MPDPVSKRIACIECRQQKVRCDAYQIQSQPSPSSSQPSSTQSSPSNNSSNQTSPTQPSPQPATVACSRCTKRGIECVLRPDFKRTYKRRRLVEVEKENEILRQSIAKSAAAAAAGVESSRGPGLNTISAINNTNNVNSISNGNSIGSVGSMNGLSNGSNLPSIASLPNISNPLVLNSLPLTSLSSNSIPLNSSPLNPLNSSNPSPLNRSPLNPLPSTSINSSNPIGSSATISSHAANSNVDSISNETRRRISLAGSLLDLSGSSPTPITKPPISKTSISNLTQPNSNSTSNINISSKPNTNTNANARPNTHHSSNRIVNNPNENIWPCSQKSMEGVTLSPSTISNLFSEFVKHYHPILPVVDISRGPESIYTLCPSLFWTIMTVASRRYDRDGSLMHQLTPLLKTCLSEITISPVTRFAPNHSPSPVLNVASVYTVQAFLIFTLWPPVTSTLSADSSWNTAGLAMYSAVRVGLHCPGYARDFGRIKADNPSYPKISEQIRTWICCNIVSQTVATVYGFPAFTSFDASVVAACHPNSLVKVAESIKQLVRIAHLEDEIAKTLNSNPKDPLGLSQLSERLPLIQILSQKLDELELELAAGSANPENMVDDQRKFVLLGARVHLLTYYFLDTNNNNGSGNGSTSANTISCTSGSDLQLQKGMVQAYNSALALMSHAETAHSNNRSFFKYLPGIHVQMLWQSTAIVCRVCHSNFAQFVDAERGRVLYARCISLILKASIFKHDMMYRASEIMQQVWRLYATLAKRNSVQSNALISRVRIRTRMAASVFFDTLWTMKEEWGIRSDAPAVLSQRNVEEKENEKDGEKDGDEKDKEDCGIGDIQDGSKPETKEEAMVNLLDPVKTNSNASNSNSNNNLNVDNEIDLNMNSISTPQTNPSNTLDTLLNSRTSYSASPHNQNGHNNNDHVYNHYNPPSSASSSSHYNNTLENPLADDIFQTLDSELCLKDVETLMIDFGFDNDEAFQTLMYEGGNSTRNGGDNLFQDSFSSF